MPAAPTRPYAWAKLNDNLAQYRLRSECNNTILELRVDSDRCERAASLIKQKETPIRLAMLLNVCEKCKKGRLINSLSGEN